MEILVGIVMGISLLFGGMSFIVGIGSISGAMRGHDDRREVAGMVITGAVLLTIAFSSAAYLGQKDRERMAHTAKYNRAHCTVIVEGVVYHPDHVRTYRGTGTMVLENGTTITFLGGTIFPGCR